MIATDMTNSGDPEEKLRWAFKMYDKDNSGKIKGVSRKTKIFLFVILCMFKVYNIERILRFELW